MEQWQHARDAEILDAWTNGGKFNGKKVTDRDMLKYYKKRRDSYERDDPEWNTWDNDMWQLRFRISNEDVMRAYRMGEIGPRAVAMHYKSWANRMPKDSSYYRNLMQSYGDFMKAAKANAQSTKKGFDYNAMLDRIDKNNKGTKGYDTMNGAMTLYAQAHGWLGTGEKIDDPGVMDRFSSMDMQILMQNVTQSTGWEQIAAEIKDEYPDWNGVLDWRQFKRMANDSIEAHRANIREYKKAPFDTRSLQAKERGDIKQLQQAKEIPDIIDGNAQVTRTIDQLQDWRRDAIDAKDFQAHDPEAIKSLSEAADKLLAAGDPAGAGAVHAIIYALQGDVEGARGIEDTQALANMGFSSDQIEQMARDSKSYTDGQELVDEGKAVYVVQQPTADSETSWRLGIDQPRLFSIKPLKTDPVSGRPQLDSDESVIVARPDSEGKMSYFQFGGIPIIGVDGKKIGYRYDIGGEKIDGFYDKAGEMKYTPTDVFNGDEGMVLVEGPNGLQVTAADATTADEASAWYGKLQTKMASETATAVLDEILGKEPGDVTTSGVQADGARPSENVPGAETPEDKAYGELQRLLGPGKSVPAYGDPSFAAIDAQTHQASDLGDPKKTAKYRMDFLRGQMPEVWDPNRAMPGSGIVQDPNVDSPEMQDVWMRSWLRQSGVDVPMTEVDKTVLNEDGSWKPRVTKEDQWKVDQGFDPDAVKNKQAEIFKATGGIPQMTAGGAPSPTPSPSTGSGASETGQLPGGATGTSNQDPLDSSAPVGQTQTGPTGSPTGQTGVRDNVGQPSGYWGTGGGGFQQFWAKGGGETSSPPPASVWTQNELFSIVSHQDYLTNPDNNLHFFSGINNAYYNASEENARQATLFPDDVFIKAEAINHQQTDVRMATETLPEVADLHTYDGLVPSVRTLIMSGADVNSVSVAADLGDTITRSQSQQNIDKIDINGEDWTGRPKTSTPRWQMPPKYGVPIFGQMFAQMDRTMPIQQTPQGMPSGQMDAPKGQPGVKLANNLANVAGINQTPQKVDAKTPYVQTLGGVRMETARIIPARAAPANIGVQQVSTALKGTPAAAQASPFKVATPQQRFGANVAAQQGNPYGPRKY
jgi:hypothetical protein